MNAKMNARLPIHLIGVFPALFLAIFFIGPLSLMLGVSFFERDPMAFFNPAFQFENYQKFTSKRVLTTIWRSVLQAGVAAGLVVSIAFTTILFVSDLTRRWQKFWILLLLSLLCLSEVIIGFAWAIVFSEPSGIPKLLNQLGLWDNPRSLSPSFWAVQTGMISIGFAVVGLLIYPQLAGRDRSIEEAARTLGTPPFYVFWKVLLPNYGPTVLTGFLTMFVYYLGVYVMPVMLGKPQDWNMTVLITDTAIQQFNLPLGAALSVGMMVMTAVALTIVWCVNLWRAHG